jgi:hypothetical protein
VESLVAHVDAGGGSVGPLGHRVVHPDLPPVHLCKKTTSSINGDAVLFAGHVYLQLDLLGSISWLITNLFLVCLKIILLSLFVPCLSRSVPT